jgi:hypothetical protein
MEPPPKRQPPKTLISFRASQALKRFVDARAAEVPCTPSEWARALFLHAAAEEGFESDETRNIPPTPSVASELEEFKTTLLNEMLQIINERLPSDDRGRGSP